MQVETSSQTNSDQQGHAPLSANTTTTPDDHERKRRYLSLLPPPQVIEICLTFDIHISATVKATVWPADLDEAIKTLQQTPGAKSVPAPASSPSTSSPADTTPKPSDPPTAPNIASETPGPPSTSTSNSAPPIQRFAFAHQPAYPHTPYYPQASWSSYSHSPYGATQPYAPLPTAVHSQPPHQETQPSDDMPSYEDMIVEALNDFRDPEGLAPKDIYTWMVDHYRVQANFRPSASQALQKAYKRGRFEKSLTGKYRLNPHWKGGTTTRRTTRRPQSHSNSLPPPPPHARHPSFPQHAQKMPVYPQPAYMFPYTPAAAQAHQSQNPEEDAAGDIGDAFEAAQHILKALNFSGDLLKSTEKQNSDASLAPSVSSTDTPTVKVADDSVASSASDGRAQLQAQLILLAAQLSEIAGISEETNPNSSVIPALSSTHELTVTSASSGNVPTTDHHSLSSQSLDLSEAVPPSREPHSTAQSEVLQPSDSSSLSASRSVTELMPMADVDDDSDDEDMDEVIV
ncbi:hypothetical protein F5878DRAFT_616338 [Lentinula raphanica]|uniref:Histone H1 n=1 Tax=Lentinula raphanica TaxID=153919 RepID=A0AA38PAQ7_9AGAR|nr:hypothetical protein F5878DRAFT_616338 [Lentinula raphanica]